MKKGGYESPVGFSIPFLGRRRKNLHLNHFRAFIYYIAGVIRLQYELKFQDFIWNRSASQLPVSLQSILEGGASFRTKNGWYRQ